MMTKLNNSGNSKNKGEKIMKVSELKAIYKATNSEYATRDDNYHEQELMYKALYRDAQDTLHYATSLNLPDNHEIDLDQMNNSLTGKMTLAELRDYIPVVGEQHYKFKDDNTQLKPLLAEHLNLLYTINNAANILLLDDDAEIDFVKIYTKLPKRYDVKTVEVGYSAALDKIRSLIS